MSNKHSAFEGIKVLDLSTRLSGAWAARLFGDFGAEVLIPETADGHFARNCAPFFDVGGVKKSLLHEYVNWNKTSTSADEVHIAALISAADIVVTTQPSELVELLDIQSIHLSITPHGLSGPWSSIDGNDLTHSANSGWAMINKFEGEEPLQLPHNQPSFISGVAGFIAAAAALFRGSREQIDVSELESTALTCVPWAILGLFLGDDSFRYGPNRRRKRGNSGPLWRTKDGLINYGYGDWQQWQNALHFLDLPELAEDPEYISAWGRHQKNKIPVIEGLEKSSLVRNKWDVFHGLAKFRCISGVVQDAKDLLHNEQLKARDFLVEIKQQNKTLTSCGAISKLSETPWRLNQQAPEQEPSTDSFTSEATQYENQSMASKPLEGIRVLCFTQAWAGTFATHILACLGADIVQIETVKRPDVWRGAGAPIPDGIKNPNIKQSPLNTNGMYNSVNLNKRAITLDVTTNKGKEMFWDLIKKFDILVDNFSPHVMSNWGVSLESLRSVRPDIIFASISGYGRQGPLAEYPANGATTEPMAGFSSIHGYEGDPGLNTGGLIPDPISGYYLTAAILVAINHRKHTGIGQRIDASMMESVAVQLGDAVMDYSANGKIRKPAGNTNPNVGLQGIFETVDGQWLALTVDTDESFRALCQFLKLETLLDDKRFECAKSRQNNKKELREIFKDAFLDRFKATQLEELQSRGITAAICGDFLDIYREPNEQFVERRFMQAVNHREAGKHLLPTMPWILKNTRFSEHSPPPCFGEHSQEVFRDELGIDDSAYADLVRLGISGQELRR